MVAAGFTPAISGLLAGGEFYSENNSMTWWQVAVEALLLAVLAAGWHKYSISRGIAPKALELYLWLTPILSLAVLSVIHDRAGLAGIVPIGVIHLALVIWAMQTAYPSAAGMAIARLAGALLILGAAVIWLGAVSFQGMGLQGIAAHRAEHLFTVGGFLVGSLISLAGFTALRAQLRELGDVLFSQLGLLALTIGTVCWILHLGFRATVMVAVAQEYAATAPNWYPPLRLWSGAMYAAYMFLAYLSIASYGAALLKTGWAGKGWGRTFVVFGLLAAAGFAGGLAGFAMPLMVQFMPYIMGMTLLRKMSAAQATNQ